MSSKWASIFEDIKRIYSSIPKLIYIYIAPLKKKKKKVNIYSIKFMPINLLSNIIRSCVELYKESKVLATYLGQSES